MKKSILIINPYLHIGGVEKALISLLRTLPKEKYNINLLLVFKEGEFLKYVPPYVKIIKPPFQKFVEGCEDKSIKGITKKYVSNGKIFSAAKLLFFYLLMQIFKYDKPFADNIFEKQNISYDYIFNFSGPNNFTSILSEKIYKSPKKFIWIHNEFKKAKKSVMKYKYRYRRYNAIFAVSEACKNEFIDIIPELKEKTNLLYNITDSDFYHEMAKGKKGFNDNHRYMRFLSVGRLNYQKGFDIAIQVAHELKKENRIFRWFIIGEGEERHKLENLIKKYNLEKYVFLLGKKENPYPFFRDCDLYIQPSRYEGYGLTIAEAKSFYKPIVCTKFAGALEQLSDHQNALIVECSVEPLKKAITEMMVNDELRTKFIKNLKETNVNTKQELEKLERFLK